MKILLFNLLLLLSSLSGICGLEKEPALVLKNGEAEIVINRNQSGQIDYWKSDGKVLIKAPAGPVIRLLADHSPSEAVFVSESSTLEDRSEETAISIQGSLKAGPKQLMKVELQYRIAKALNKVILEIRFLEKDATLHEIDALSWKLPLALNPRKKTYFRGDHGLDWESRYFYQFHATSAGAVLVDEPDRNEWRYFALEQLGEASFRLWKAEGDTTPPVMMQEGRNAAHYMQLFDEEKGMTLQYPQLAEAAPKSLRVDAALTGAFLVDFWPSGTRSLAVDSSEAKAAIFGRVHQLELSIESSEASRTAIREELNAKMPVSSEPDSRSVLKEPSWLRETPLTGQQPLYVTAGYPFEKGELKQGGVVLLEMAGKSVPVQSKPLGFWPDGSIKWAQLTFPLDASLSVKEAEPPYVSLRNGEFIPVKISVGRAATATVAKPLVVQPSSKGGFRINTGPLVAELEPGDRWLHHFALNGKELLETSSPKRLAYAEYRRDFEAALPFKQPQGGTIDAASLKVEEISVVESGPLRAVIRLAGKIPNNEETSVILWIEFLAGRSDIKITHSVEFLFKDPTKTILTGLGMQIPIHLRGSVEFSSPGMAGKMSLNASDKATLLQQTPVFAELSLIEGQRRKSLTAEQSGEGWIMASSTQCKVVGAIRNFRQLAPAGLSLSSGSIDFQLWPGGAYPMDVRRYSRHFHKAQGEARGSLGTTVETGYDANEPFGGVSRSHEIYFGVFDPASTTDAASLAADFESPPLLYAGWARYVKTKAALPGFDEKLWPRASEALSRFAAFWLYHREIHQWYGFWNYGDVRHYFRSGYGWILPPQQLIQSLASGEKSANPNNVKNQILDYSPPNDWAFDNGRWGWSNTEGLPSTYFQNEYLRQGNRAIFFAAESMARHARDVVTRQAGKWVGLGTRHGVQHWSDGNHEERQTVALEYKLHYFLTGEPRTRETSDKLYLQRYSCKPVSQDASHSGRLAGLFFHWELTNSPQEEAQFVKYVHMFAIPEGILEEPHVRFPGPETVKPGKTLNGGSMFFHVFGGMETLLEYQNLTEDPILGASLIRSADAFLDKNEKSKWNRPNNKTPPLVIGPLVYAARNASSPQRYREFFKGMFERYAWKFVYQPVTKNEKHWSGDSGYLVTKVPGSWFWMNYCSYFVGALPPDAQWTPEMEGQFQAIETAGDPKKGNQVSWQSEYDRYPELDAYLGAGQPWRGDLKKKPSTPKGAESPESESPADLQ